MSSTVVKYNTKEIIPVDNVSIVYNMGRIANDDCLKTTYSIDIHGYLIYNAGSPNTSGTFGHFSSSECEIIPQDEMLHALLAKQCALGNLFSEHYKELELGTNVGNPNLYAYPRVVSINIDDTSRPNYWPYTVSLEADNIYCDGSPIGPTGCPCINSYTESWDISYDENEFISESGNNRLWKITHNLNAVGAGIAGPSGFTTTPYECAKDFICSRKGINSVVPQTCIDEFSCTGQMYNYYDSHSIDETAGSYSLTESWYCTEFPYIEQYTVETSESSDQACPTVSINGSIRGFEIRTNGSVTTSRYQSSKARYDELEASTGILTWAEDLSGYDLDSNPTSKTYSLNKYTGDISFSATYRKLPFKWLPSAKFENVSIFSQSKSANCSAERCGINSFGSGCNSRIIALGID